MRQPSPVSLILLSTILTLCCNNEVVLAFSSAGKGSSALSRPASRQPVCGGGSAGAGCFSVTPAGGLTRRVCGFGGAGIRSGKTGGGRSRSDGSTSLDMFMGSDGGILGVGTPEVVTILLVGYFVLGPSELYKLVKEIGKFIQNFRTLSTQATESFQNTMEDQLELQEIRKAQRELTDAFSFRRSINVDETAEPFAEENFVAPAATAAATATAGASAAAEGTVAPPKKKKIRRRVRKKKAEKEADEDSANGQVPDLDLTSPFEEERNETDETSKLREERLARLQSGTQPSSETDWFSSGEGSIAEEVLRQQSDLGDTSTAAEKERFASQLSGQWNEQILEHEDELSPLAKIMERLAILEEEKNAATARLEEEFRLRSEIEEEYYREKRALLESAAAEVQADAYVGLGGGNSEKEGSGSGGAAAGGVST